MMKQNITPFIHLQTLKQLLMRVILMIYLKNFIDKLDLLKKTIITQLNIKRNKKIENYDETKYSTFYSS